MRDSRTTGPQSAALGVSVALAMILGIGLLSLFVGTAYHGYDHSSGDAVVASSGRAFDNFGERHIVLMRRAFMVLLSLFTLGVSLESTRRRRVPWLILMAIANPIVFIMGVAFAQMLTRATRLPWQAAASLDPIIYGCLVGSCLVGVLVGVLIHKGGNRQVAHI